MPKYRTILNLMRILLDYTLIAAAFYLADSLNAKYTSEIAFNYLKELSILLLLLITWVFSANATKLYDEFRSRNFSFELIILMKNVGVQVIASIILIFIIKDIQYSRTFVLYYAVFLFILLVVEKYLLSKVLDSLRRKGRNLRTILIIGAGELGKNFFKTINKNKHFGYRVLGFLDDAEVPNLNGNYLGSINELRGVLEKNHVDNVMVALPNYAEERIQEVIDVCRLKSIRVRLIPDYFRFASPKYNVSMFGRFPVVSVREEIINEIHWRFWKRIADIAISAFVIIFFFPWFIPLTALIIKLDSKGPVFFRQVRWGRDNRKFIAYKFRSMQSSSSDTDKDGKYLQASVGDPRVTRFGRIMRKLNIDEFPQFINVLKGDMSVVGPRPHPEPLNVETNKKIPHYMMRHYVKPGITGWAQVNGYRGETKDPELMQKRVEYDLWYIENWSFWLDIQIVFLTVWVMFRGDRNAY